MLVVAQGPREAGESLLELLQGGAAWPTQPGRVDKVVADWSQPQERFEGSSSGDAAAATPHLSWLM